MSSAFLPAGLSPATDHAIELEGEGTAAERIAAIAARSDGTRNSGRRAANAIARVVESELADGYAATLGRRGPVRDDHAIVLVGGTGRGWLCPDSDADLLILTTEDATPSLREGVDAFVQDLWDRGIRPGHSVRTDAEALRAAREDISFAAALTTARHFAGSPVLTERLRHRFTDMVVRRRPRQFVDACVASRERERAAYGGTPCRLEPDVKRGPGGLRDIDLIGWIGYARHATADLDQLVGYGLFGRSDYGTLRQAIDLLLSIRIALHVSAGRRQDLFSRDTQAKLAARQGIVSPAGMLPVEAFMRDYFQTTTAVRDIADRVVASHRPRPTRSKVLRKLLVRRAGKAFLVGPHRVEVRPAHLTDVLASPVKLVELFELVARRGVELSTSLETAIAVTVDALPRPIPVDAASAFMRLLADETGGAATLRAMHRVGLLSYFVPAFEHARGLTQFSEYHSFTVDEHTLRAVAGAVDFLKDDGPVGAAARAVDDPALLRLALLLHDVGKGYEGDHSEVGGDLAREVAAGLSLDAARTDRLELLVREHLVLAHAAFRRDTNDPALLADLARRVGDAGTLRLLYVLTACDLAAVGEGVWTDWKQELLTLVYDRVTGVLAGRPPAGDGSEAARRRDAVLELARRRGRLDDATRTRITARLEQVSAQYLASVRRGEVLDDMLDLERVVSDEEIGPLVSGRFDEETDTIVYRVVVGPRHGRGCFAKTAGALAAKRLLVHEALIESTPEGAAADRYRVSDDDFAGRPPGWRIQDVCRTIEDALRDRLATPPSLGRSRYDAETPSLPATWSSPRVSIDTSLSTRCTILDVFTVDRPGLLYGLATTLQELGLSVELAKISTHLDQVVDVFYVTDAEGRKVTDADRLMEIRGRLEAAIVSASPVTASSVAAGTGDAE